MASIAPETLHDTPAYLRWYTQLLVAFVARWWDRVQVELHGRFSLQRVEQMREYSHRTSFYRVVLVGVLTPIPVLIVITLLDCIPLVSPDEGSSRNYAFWVRMMVVTGMIIAGPVNHFRCCLPSLVMTDWELFLVAFVSMLAGSGLAYGFSLLFGFPVPFTLLVESIPALPVVLLSLVYLWRPILRGNQALQHDLVKQIWVLCGQFIMVWIYPLYLFAFSSMPSMQQSVFTFVLPVIKMIFKNYFSGMLHQLDDRRPAFVVFNADLFNALYVSNCLQSSQSWVNTLIVMFVDIAQMAVSMYDVRIVMNEVHSLVSLDDFDGSLLDLCVAMSRSSDVQEELESRSTSSKTLLPTNRESLHRSNHRSFVLAPLPIVSPCRNDLVQRLAAPERVRLVHKISKALYIAEFLLLIEFVEVVIPVIYGLYLGAMSHLSNRAYYPRLASSDANELVESMSTVMFNAGLEFVSFLLASWLLDRQLRLSSFRMLGFVLESQRSLIQSSLIAWTLYVIQQSLVHTGIDFTLQFAWLRDKNE